MLWVSVSPPRVPAASADKPPELHPPHPSRCPASGKLWRIGGGGADQSPRMGPPPPAPAGSRRHVVLSLSSLRPFLTSTHRDERAKPAVTVSVERSWA